MADHHAFIGEAVTDKVTSESRNAQWNPNPKRLTRPLNNSHLLYVSKRITDAMNLRHLANKLGLSPHIAETAIHDNRSIINASYQVLHQWDKNQQDKYQAMERLCSALDKIGLEYVSHKFLMENVMISK